MDVPYASSMNREEIALDVAKRGVIVSTSRAAWDGKVTRKDAARAGFQFPDLARCTLLPEPYRTRLATVIAARSTALVSMSLRTSFGFFVSSGMFLRWEAKDRSLRDSASRIMGGVADDEKSLCASAVSAGSRYARAAWGKLYPSDKGEPSPAFTSECNSMFLGIIPPQEAIRSGRLVSSISPVPILACAGILAPDMEALVKKWYSGQAEDLSRVFIVDVCKAYSSAARFALSHLISGVRKDGVIRASVAASCPGQLEALSLMWPFQGGPRDIYSLKEKVESCYKDGVNVASGARQLLEGILKLCAEIPVRD